MATASELETWLNEALEAQRKLLTGMSAVTVRDSSGRMVQYAPINANALREHIRDLQEQLAVANGVTSPTARRKPLLVRF